MALKDVFILIPGNCEYVTLTSKRHSEDRMNLSILIGKVILDCPEVCDVTQVPTRVLKEGGDRTKREDDVMTKED